MKQPKIDLDNMVVVPFERREASAGPQESVAVQTSPPEEETSDGAVQRRPAQSGIGSMFRRRSKVIATHGKFAS